MSRHIDYVGPSCGKHVDEPSELQLIGRAVGGAFVALLAGGFVFAVIWLTFFYGPGP